MKKRKIPRTHLYTMRMTPDEYALLEQNWRKSTIRVLSEYVRRMVFSRPMVSSYRNRSLDDLMAELILLRRDLDVITVNFDQAAGRLQWTGDPQQRQSWLKDLQADRSALLNKVEEIKIKLRSINEVWLR